MADPYCLAMVLCDAVHMDRATGKCTILGTFSAVNTVVLPAKVLFHVYAEITDGSGTVELQLRISESRAFIEDSLVDKPFEWVQPEPLSVNMTSPLAVYQVVLSVHQEFPRIGQYHCELLANGREIMARRLLVIDAQPTSNRGDDHG